MFVPADRIGDLSLQYEAWHYCENPISEECKAARDRFFTSCEQIRLLQDASYRQKISLDQFIREAVIPEVLAYFNRPASPYPTIRR
jgi:hypothetical protein